MFRRLLLAAAFLSATLTGLPTSRAAGVCTMVWAPVCAVKDGVEKTYSNRGCAKAEAAKVVRKGRCEDPNPSQATYCPERFDPVCASKGAVDTDYSNACFALADGATIKHAGKCGSDR